MDEVNVKKFTYADFTDKKILGEGSFNQVYNAKHPKLGLCVLKIVARCFVAKPRQKKKLEKEAASMFSIHHENLIQGYGVVMEPNHLCLVYEYAQYGCLADALRRIPRHITWPLKIRISYQVASGLSYLHNPTNGVIHRNLKSSNVLLDQDFNVKVADFIYPLATTWVSQATQQKETTERKKKAEGQAPARKSRSLAHIPPEIVLNINAQATPSYDVYSFGVILWEMLTNKTPFDGALPEEVYRKMAEGYEHPFDVVLANRPEILFDLMKEALCSGEIDRPSFQRVGERLKPSYEDSAITAFSDAIECKKAYDDYKAAKRDRTAQRQGSLEPQASKHQLPARLISVAEAASDSDEEESVGQVVGTSARVALPPQSHPYRIQQKQASSVSAVPSTHAAQPTEEAGDKMDVDPPLSTSNQEAANSYGEPAQTLAKTIPFEDPPSVPQPLQATFPAPNQAVYNIQAEHINLHVGDNTAPSSGPRPSSSDPPTPTTPSNIPALGSQRAVTREDMYTVVNNVGSRSWKWMARSMNLNDSQIDAIDYDHEKDGLKEKIYQVLRKWKLKYPGQVTIGELANILQHANLSGVAAALPP